MSPRTPEKPDPRSEILRYLQRHKSAAGSDLARHLAMSRQGVNKHLRSLALEGRLVKQGTTKGTLYTLSAGGPPPPQVRSVEKRYSLEDLAEDQVFRELSGSLLLPLIVSPKSLDIVRYAFTEILNNAIEHSRSPYCRVRLSVGPYDCEFTVRDAGIGIFRSIEEKLGFPDESTALGELLKGKTTTMKERHSGEGIFFVSRAADLLSIRSHKQVLEFDNKRRDIVVRQDRFLKGTDVRFAISTRSRRDLSRIFLEHAPEEYNFEFQKTKVLVRLYLKDFVSRSEAKRLLHGLENFQDVVLDFSRVKTIAQGFADEVFRVFPSQHPGTKVRAENANPVIQQMIRHVAGGTVPG